MTAPAKKATRARITAPLALGSIALSCGIILSVRQARDGGDGPGGSSPEVGAQEFRADRLSAGSRSSADSQASLLPADEEGRLAAKVSIRADSPSSVASVADRDLQTAVAEEIGRRMEDAAARRLASAAQRAEVLGHAPSLPISHSITPGQLAAVAPEVPAEVLEKIRDEFEAEAGIADLDPADPEYARRWALAVPTAADRIRALYGWGAYAEFVRQAALAAPGS